MNPAAVRPATVQPAVRSRRGARGVATEVGAALWTPLRLLARHWPVLFVLGAAGVGAREGLITAAVWAAGINNYLGFLVFFLAPVVVVVAVVLMLLTVRGSLVSLSDRVRAGSLLRDLGSVLIPFVAFYMAFGLMEEDFREYSAGLSERYESFGAVLDGKAQNDVRVWGLGTDGLHEIRPLLVIVVIAFLIRWALDKWELTRRTPLLGIPGVFLECVWVVLGLQYVIKPLIETAEAWAGERKAWHAVLNWWHGLDGLTGPFGRLYHLADGWLVAAFPSGNFTRIFLVPLTGLVSAAVVYRLTVSEKIRPPAVSGRMRWLQWVIGGIVYGISRRFAPLVQGIRAMGRSGALPVMYFCLTVVALETGAQWLRKAEWVLLGPQEDPRFQVDGLPPTIEGLNSTLMLVMMACVLAAAVDGVVRRNNLRGAISQSDG
jgi:hypothetical protein